MLRKENICRKEAYLLETFTTLISYGSDANSLCNIYINKIVWLDDPWKPEKWKRCFPFPYLILYLQDAMVSEFRGWETTAGCRTDCWKIPGTWLFQTCPLFSFLSKDRRLLLPPFKGRTIWSLFFFSLSWPTPPHTHTLQIVPCKFKIWADLNMDYGLPKGKRSEMHVPHRRRCGVTAVRYLCTENGGGSEHWGPPPQSNRWNEIYFKENPCKCSVPSGYSWNRVLFEWFYVFS